MAVPTDNLALATIEAITAGRLRHQLESVTLRAGQVLHEPGGVLPYIYFPTVSQISLVHVMKNGDSVESSLIGSDGLVGVANILGGDSMPVRAVVQVGGGALRMRAAILHAETARSPGLLRYLLRYAQYLLIQTSQLAACNRRHTLDSQFCRRLLQALDRSASNELRVTHEGMGLTMGVRRESITLTAARLQDAGIISYSRGRIRVLDRVRLESESCECYGLIRDESRRLLSWHPSPMGSVSYRTDALIPAGDAASRNGYEHHQGWRGGGEQRGSGDRRRMDRRNSGERRRFSVPCAFPQRRSGLRDRRQFR